MICFTSKQNFKSIVRFLGLSFLTQGEDVGRVEATQQKLNDIFFKKFFFSLEKNLYHA